MILGRAFAPHHRKARGLNRAETPYKIGDSNPELQRGYLSFHFGTVWQDNRDCIVVPGALFQLIVLIICRFITGFPNLLSQ